MRHLRKRNPSDIETALAGAYRSTAPKSRLQTAKEKLVQQLTEAYRASDDDPEGQKIILERLRRLAARNPLSEKRRALLKERLFKHVGLDLESIEGITPPELKKRQKDLEVILDMIHQADPSIGGENAGWIIKLFLHNKIRLPEDTEKLNTRLAEFAKLKHKFPVELRDLNRYPDYPSLAETIDQYSGVLGKREEERVKTAEGQEIIFEGETHPQGPLYRVIKVTTTEASAKLARHTDWCIKDPRAARDYLAGGPLYFIDKDSKRYLLAWSNCVVDVSLFPLWERFQVLMQEHQAKQTCIVCDANTAPSGDFLCPEHFDWKGSLEDANCDRQSFKEMAGILSEIPKSLQDQVGNLLQFRSSAGRNRDSFRDIELQIMDVYDRPVKISDDELDLIQKVFPECATSPEFFLRLCGHTKNFKFILKEGASFLGKATPEQILEIYKAYLYHQSPDSNDETHLAHLPVSYLRSLVQKQKISRWKEAEPYIFQSPSAAYDYYTLLETSLRPSEVAEFRELIQKHPVTMPTIKKVSTDSDFHQVGFPDPENYQRRINAEYQRRAGALEAWKSKQMEKFATKVDKAGHSFRKQLKNTSEVSQQQQKIIEEWGQTYIPQLEAGEIQLVDIVRPLFRELRRIKHGSWRSRTREIAQQILLPYVNYYGKGYLIFKGRRISLGDYLGMLQKATRRSRRMRRRGHVSDQVKKRETNALVAEVEKIYKKKIKARH